MLILVVDLIFPYSIPFLVFLFDWLYFFESLTVVVVVLLLLIIILVLILFYFNDIDIKHIVCPDCTHASNVCRTTSGSGMIAAAEKLRMYLQTCVLD